MCASPTPPGRRSIWRLTAQRSDFDRTGVRIIVEQTLELVARKDGPTVPAKVVFWGTTPKPVDFPFVFKDVPLR